MAGEIMVARRTATLMFQGRRVVIEQGRTTARAGHPLVDNYDGMWEPLTVDFDVDEAPAEPRAEPKPRARRKTTG
jgi:hypothetical protein